MLHLEELLLDFSTLILVNIFIARVINNLGVPILLLFLDIGMLAGSEGSGDIAFTDTKLAQSVGITSLIFILFRVDWLHIGKLLNPFYGLLSV